MAVIKRYKIKNRKKKVFYQAQVYVRSARLAYKSFDTKAEAVIWHEEQKRQLTQSPQALFKQSQSEMYFSDCFKKYVREALPLLGRSSREAYQCRFRYFTKGPLPHIKMGEFKARVVYAWIEWLKRQETSKNPRRKTFLKELEFLKVILNWHRNFVDEDFNVPVTKKHSQLCRYKPVPGRRPDYYAKPEELRAFVKWLRENNRNPVYWRLALFMILTGARVSEACGMMWECVDLERGQARVVRKMGWDHKTKKPYLEETTKTDSSIRLLLLSKELIEILREMKQESRNSERLLFTGRNNEALKYNAIQLNFNAGFKALRLPWRSTHILRHSYATGALMATQSLSAVQAALGHTSSRMTERYAKVTALLDRRTAEKTARFFDIFGKSEISRNKS